MAKAKPVGGYREMLLLELVARYHPVYPEGSDWQQTAEYLYGIEPEHMETLTSSLETRGWREPILLSDLEDLEEGERPVVLDGTHRVAIALREGVISVPVATASELSGGSESTVVELTVELVSGEPIGEDEDWSVFDLLRSFELNDELWLNTSIGHGAGDRWAFYYDSLDDTLFRLLKRRATAILRDGFPGRKFRLTAKSVDLDAEDE